MSRTHSMTVEKSDGWLPLPPTQFVETPKPYKRPAAMMLLDITVLTLLGVLPATWMFSPIVFIVNLAVALAIVLSVYFRLVAVIFTALGPQDTPHVIAVIKAPERLFCPKCGEPKTAKYCTACGVNIEQQYRRMVRKLAYYVSEDTEQQREYLEASNKAYLDQIAKHQSEENIEAIKKLERAYVMEFARQRKELRVCRQRLLEGDWLKEAEAQDRQSVAEKAGKKSRKRPTKRHWRKRNRAGDSGNDSPPSGSA